MSNETIPKNLTFLSSIVDKATSLMKLRDFGDNFSGFLSQLVREEYERRHGPVMFKQPTPTRTGESAASSDEASSRTRSHSRTEMDNSRKPRKFPKG